MKKYRFKKVLLVIACFSLVIVMTACGSGGSGGGSHASISTDPDNPSKLTFPETIENDNSFFYQSIYNSTVDDPDAEPGTIYGCYQGTLTNDSTLTFIACKPKLSPTIAQAIADNGLKYFVIQIRDGEDILSNTIYVFKNDASYDAVSRDQETIEVIGRCDGISLGAKYDYMEAGGGHIDPDFTTFNERLEDYTLETIGQIIEH